MDIAVSLVEAYLRASGYLTLAELPVFRRAAHGEVETVTDIDVVGVRFPGDLTPPTAVDRHPELLLLNDPVLDLRADMIDLIIGEVKQGQARLNPAIRSREALHAVLHRVRWLFPPGGLDAAMRTLAGEPMVVTRTRDGAMLRVRLVAFGQAPESDLHTIDLGHVIRVTTGFLGEHRDVLRAATFSSPAGAFLHLLSKTGLGVVGDGD